jgi:predicted ArsR family transcriptional regulator
VTGRDIDERELAVQFDEGAGCWRYLGEADTPERTEAEQEVYELLEEMGEADAGALACELGKHRSSIFRALKRLQAKGHVQAREVPASLGKGKRFLFSVVEGVTESQP